MGLKKYGAEGNENRKPNKQLGEFDNEEEISDIEDVDDSDVEYDEEDSDDEELEIPDDPIMEARLAALRAENEFLKARAREQEDVRAVVFGRADEWKRSVEALQTSLNRAKALIKEREEAKMRGREGEGGCKPQKGPNGRGEHEDDDEGTSKGQNQAPIEVFT